MWEKEKLLVTSSFSFSQCVFKRLVLQTRKNQGFVRERVKVMSLVDSFIINLKEKHQIGKNELLQSSCKLSFV